MPIIPQKKTPIKRLTDINVLIRRINRELVAKHGLPPGSNPADPAEFLVRVMAGEWPNDILRNCVAGSPDDLKDTPVPQKMSMDAAEILMRYTRQQLAAMEVSGPEGGPIPIGQAPINISDIIKVPELREKLEKLSLEMSGIRRQRLLASHDTLEAQDTTAVTISTEEGDSNERTLNERSGPDDPGQDS